MQLRIRFIKGILRKGYEDSGSTKGEECLQ
jgi:hypothetical protein